MKYLLDTNIVVHWLRGGCGIADAVDSAGLENCCISEITKAELLYGELKAAQRGMKVDRKPLLLLFSTLDIIPVSDALELYASEKVRLESSGAPLGDFDLMIGCTAVSCGLVMVSENVEHLRRISGIRLENWAVR